MVPQASCFCPSLGLWGQLSVQAEHVLTLTFCCSEKRFDEECAALGVLMHMQWRLWCLTLARTGNLHTSVSCVR